MTSKADQIAYRFYTKLGLVLQDARSTAEPKANPKVDKWFNLETPENSEAFRDVFKVYKSISTSRPPPCELQVLLAVPELGQNQVLVYNAPDLSRCRVEPTPRYILLESWVINFTPTPTQDDDVAPATSYKHGIPLFRSVFSLLRLLPAWKLFKRLRRRTGGNNRNGNLSMQLRVRSPGDSQDDIMSFNTLPARHASASHNETHTFPPIPHSAGNLTVSTTYLSSPNFQLDELERFLSLDEGSEFTPTLTKNQQRDSIAGNAVSDSRNRISGSPGSLPIRTSLPRSPPSSNHPLATPSSIADRFVLPLQSRATSEQSPRNVPLPMGRFASTGGAVDSVASSSRHSSSYASSHRDDSRVPGPEDGRPASWNREASGLAARLRKESTGRGSDLAGAPSPSPVRRPSIFKSSTLGSPALLTHSPSLNSPSTSARQTSPLSAFPPRPLSVSSRQSLPSPVGGPGPSLIGVGSRPSPSSLSAVGVPSSLGDRRSLASANEGEDSPSTSLSHRPTRKRYSSSFGHRYASGGSGGAASYAASQGVGSYAASAGSFPGSQASGGSGGERGGEKNASFLSTNTDDDNISIFMQDIDSRKPLAGRHRVQSISLPPGHSDDRGSPSPDLHPLIASGAASISPQTRTMPLGTSEDSNSASTIAPMLTTESEVDERLKQMNATFMASLQGLGGGPGGSGKSRRRERMGSEDTQRAASIEPSSVAGSTDREYATVGRGGTRLRNPLPVNRETAHRSVSLVDPTRGAATRGAAAFPSCPGIVRSDSEELDQDPTTPGESSYGSSPGPFPPLDTRTRDRAT